MENSSKKFPLILVLDNVRSLFNVGAVFRSADGAGVEKIILAGLTPTPPRHEIEKTALGATKTVLWEYLVQLKAYLTAQKKAGFCLAALEQTKSSQNLFKSKLEFPLILIAGHEREGVQPEILDLCDLHLEIPMCGQSAHSLNVSSAVSIALYEARRQYDSTSQS